jgi:hypothetical protein
MIENNYLSLFDLDLINISLTIKPLKNEKVIIRCNTGRSFRSRSAISPVKWGCNKFADCYRYFRHINKQRNW